MLFEPFIKIFLNLCFCPICVFTLNSDTIPIETALSPLQWKSRAWFLLMFWKEFSLWHCELALCENWYEWIDASILGGEFFPGLLEFGGTILHVWSSLPDHDAVAKVYHVYIAMDGYNLNRCSKCCWSFASVQFTLSLWILTQFQWKQLWLGGNARVTGKFL